MGTNRGHARENLLEARLTGRDATSRGDRINALERKVSFLVVALEKVLEEFEEVTLRLDEHEAAL